MVILAPGHETIAIPITGEQASRIVVGDGVSTDLIYNRVLLFGTDESEDTRLDKAAEDCRSQSAMKLSHPKAQRSLR
jgi:hypothetical protein